MWDKFWFYIHHIGAWNTYKLYKYLDTLSVAISDICFIVYMCRVAMIIFGMSFNFLSVFLVNVVSWILEGCIQIIIIRAFLLGQDNCLMIWITVFKDITVNNTADANWSCWKIHCIWRGLANQLLKKDVKKDMLWTAWYLVWSILMHIVLVYTF